jgi:prepilin-type N-terminal cleavage/methylation domain-containing protein
MKTLFRIRAFGRTQKGLTLVELIVAIAISALIGTVVVTGVFQIIKINAKSTNRQIAISQVQNAVNSISRDAEQAQQISPTSFSLSTGGSLTMQWTTWGDQTASPPTSPQHYVVVYSILSTNLQRTITVDSGAASTTVIANSINAASGTWNASTKVLNFTALTAAVGTTNTVTETRTFQINPRSAQ